MIALVEEVRLADRRRDRRAVLLRVLPDPEAKERLEAIYKALEIEINKAYPNSRIRLTLVGDKLMISGQAHDAPEANQILAVVNANAPGVGGPANRPPLGNISPTAGVGGGPAGGDQGVAP